MGFSISTFGKLFGAFKPATTRAPAVPKNSSAEQQRRAPIGLKSGYTAHNTPAGPIYTTATPEAGYFSEEREYAPTIMTVESPSMAGPNSAHARRARFEDPAEEFTNAGPKVARKPIDYSIFTVRADTVPSEPAPAKDIFEVPEVVEVAEDTSTKAEEVTVTEIPAPIEITPIQESIREEPAAEVAPVDVAPIEETVEEIVPVETPVIEVTAIDDAEVTETEVAESEESPAAEIAASTSFIGGVAGCSGMAETSLSIPMPVVPIFLNDEAEAVRYFDPLLDFDANECEPTLEESDIPDDDMERRLAEDIEIEELQAALENQTVAASSETPVIEVVPVEEPSVEIAPVEEPVEFFPVQELADVVEVPVDYMPSEEISPSEEIPAIAAPAQVFCLPPAEDVKFIEAPSEPVIEVAPVEEAVEVYPVQELADVVEVPVDYTPAVEVPAVEENVEFFPVEELADVVEEPVVYVPCVDVPETEEPVIDMTVDEEPVVEIAPTERKAEPSIIRRGSVDPADVAAILFGL